MIENDNTAQRALLAGLTPLAHGAVRDVWDRPDHPNQILKTIRAYKRDKYAQRKGLRRSIDQLRFGPYGTFMIEYRCYMQTAYQCAQLQRPLPIAEIGGLILTDHGLAQVCEKITDASGQLAQTLNALLKSGQLTPERLNWLNDFIKNIYELNVNVPDITAKNIVLDDKRKQFILIDGYGDKTLLPVRSWVRSLNQKQLDARFAIIGRKNGVQWDPEAKTFSLTQ